MRHLSIALLATAAIAGCVSKPHHTQDAPPSTGRNELAPASAAPGAPAAAAAPKSVSEASRDAQLASKYPPGVNIELIKQGYAVAQKDGGFVYCRKDAVTGSRFTQRVCLSESQIRENEQRAKDAMFNRNNGTCSGGMCTN